MSEATLLRAPHSVGHAPRVRLGDALCEGLRWRKYHYRRDTYGRPVYGRMRAVNGAECFEALWVELGPDN